MSHRYARLQCLLYFNNSTDAVQHLLCQSPDDRSFGTEGSIFQIIEMRVPSYYCRGSAINHIVT
jgi:hypothetical protein